jgi:hypothetical protein
MRSALFILGIALIGQACNTDMPTGAQSAPTRPLFVVAGNSGCYTVAGTISETGVFPTFTGTVSGDLIGTSVTTLGFDARSTGIVIHNPGERTLTITGGSIPQLVGVTIHETFEGLTIFESHPLERINGRVLVDGGAQRGNLTDHGTLNLATFPWEVEVEYRGVICP